MFEQSLASILNTRQAWRWASNIYIICDILLRKMSFSLFKRFSMVKSFLIGEGSCTSCGWFPLSSLRFCLVRSYCHTFWMYMYISAVIQRALISWSHIPHLVSSEILSDLPSTLIPKPWWKGLVKTTLLGPVLLSWSFCPLSSYLSLGYAPCSGKEKFLSYSTDVCV